MTDALPIRRYRIILTFTRPASFRFLHGGAVHGLLCRALGVHPLPATVIPYAPESGRVRYEPGDRYALAVTLVGEAHGLLDTLLAGLAEIGKKEPPRDHPLPTFGGNFQLSSCEALPPPDLEAETEALLAVDSVTLRFVSPLRMRRPTTHRQPGQAFFNAAFFPFDLFLRRVAGRCAAFGFPASFSGGALGPPDDAHLVWLDLPVRASSQGPEGSGGVTLGGVVGTVTVSGLDVEACRLLALGRHLQAGEAVHFGLGRWVFEVPGLAPDPLCRAETLLHACAKASRLRAAWDHVVQQSEVPGVDGITPEALRGHEGTFLEALAQELVEHRYVPSPLAGVLIPKENGQPRALAIPTLRDRVAQRAACDLLSPAIDTLLEESSYAYRRGLSRTAAAVALQRAYEEGYRFVLDADISSFFDSVEWATLFAKLEALYPGEPLMQLVKAWVTAPVFFAGKTVERSQGLPQGAVISPLLANLYLDQLDEELQAQGFRLVRYADDFVVLCRSEEDARRAQEAARQALAKLGLQLNPEKTAIRSFEQGFTYLGYLFCRSLVLEKKKEASPSNPERPLDIPKASWLAAVPLAELRQLTLASPKQARAAGPSRSLPQKLAPEPPPRRPLYLVEPTATLSLEGETLQVASPALGSIRIGLATLSHVVVIGRCRATLPALLALAQRGVPTFFCRRTGELYAQLQPRTPSLALQHAQLAFVHNQEARLAFARSIVQAKLHNAATLATRHKLQGWGALGEKLRELERACLEQTTVKALLGLEGKGAALFYAALAASLPAAWGFSGRKRNPPPDPVNAMLSLAYTVLYNHTATALLACGLDPRVGLVHQQRGSYYALACDLQEEFRHLAEGYVIALVRRREIRPDDFVTDPGASYPCLLRHEARRRFLAGFERRLVTPFTPPHGESTTYLAFIADQAAAVRALIEGRGAYHPLRLHA